MLRTDSARGDPQPTHTVTRTEKKRLFVNRSRPIRITRPAQSGPLDEVDAAPFAPEKKVRTRSKDITPKPLTEPHAPDLATSRLAAVSRRERENQEHL